MFFTTFALYNKINMYQTLLTLHSMNRYLVLVSLVSAIFIAGRGLRFNKTFSASDNTVRHLTATIAHIQLMLGLPLYFLSPIVKYGDNVFFRVIHIALMIAAIVIITIGAAKAKRMETDKAKFNTMLVWFSIALVIIFIAIPWPFSPLAYRPYFRSF